MPLTKLFTGDSQMARRMREHDWSPTPLGPATDWLLALRSPLDICLGSSFPIAIYWGPQLALLYNDAWSPILGNKHPWALGRPAREVWPEIWDTIGPMFAQVFATGQATRSQDQLLPMHRHGFTEECWFDYTFSPIRGENGEVEGIFNAVVETTFRHIGERRTQLLRQLGERTANAPSTASACERAASVLTAFAGDLPFALLYLLAPDGTAQLAGRSGLEAGTAASPVTMTPHAAAWPLEEALHGKDGVVVESLSQRFGHALPGGPWPEPCELALVLPVAPSAAQPPAGVLVAGISPRIALDSEYRAFIERAAATVGAAVAGAQANEQQRARAEALAEIDRAKTAFFTNVSHELRTPLALMLGPLEDLHDSVQAGTQRELVATAQRNAERLLKLVNTLLDFARVEGGRADATFEPVDLAAATADLASTFRAACERAGLVLSVDCPRLPQPVYVDRGQWEKIVLNLLSNAFKFTLDGEIAVTVRPSADGTHAELAVRDTGIGIPAAEMGKLFGRFQRIEGRGGRSFEGSGIGLALVQELVRLHGGTIGADSVEDHGSTFTVSVPFGSAHLPAERVRPAATPPRALSHAAAFVGEALQWLPGGSVALETDSSVGTLDPLAVAATTAAPLPNTPRILVADDNADLRAYVARLLGTRYSVQTAADGLDALSVALADPPDLVISDVMMPRLDGFGLIERLRADARTRTLPVIVLSARAGEEARVEGLAAGADDYLVKPFSARELLARVGAHLAAARIRREADAARRQSEQQLGLALGASRAGAWTWQLDTGANDWSPELFRMFAVDPADPDKVAAARQRIDREDLAALLRRAEAQLASDGEVDVEFRIQHPSDGLRWFNTRGRRLQPDRVVGLTFDITERKANEAALHESEQRFRTMADTAPAMLWVTDQGNALTFISRGWFEHTGQCEEDAYRGGIGWTEMVHPDDREATAKTFADAAKRRESFELEYRLHRADGSYRWAIDAGHPRLADDGSWLGYIGSVIDVHERTQAREALREADRRKDEFLATLAHELRNPLAPIRNALHLLNIAGPQAHSQRIYEMLDRQVSHMVRLVDDLMEASRINQGKLELKREVVELADVLRAAVEISKPLIDRGRHELRIVLPDEPLPVDGDPVRLAQVFSNLLNNAAKYTDEGGRIELAAWRGASTIQSSVQDNGIGISADQLPKLFQMFAQIDQGHGRTQGGLGIGLSLAQCLVQMHGGHIEGTSDGLGRGSKFTVQLPLADIAATEARHPAAAAAGLNARRVLVVDDNGDAADSLAMVLRYLGAEVRVEHVSANALQAVREWRPTVVLLDLGMPGMDGFEVARRLRADTDFQGLTLIALTGWGQEQDRQRTNAVGFDHHLIKPVDIDVLQTLLASMD